MDVPAGIAINAHKAGLRPIPPSRSSISGDSSGGDIHSDTIAFKNQLEVCIDFLRNLISIMVRSTEESHLARPYLHPIIRRLDNELVRMEIWASDVGAFEPGFGRSVQVASIDLELTRYITTMVNELHIRLQECEKKVEEIRSAIGRMSGSRFNDFKLDRRLRRLLTQIDEECQRVNILIRNLVSLTEAFRIEQAVKLQSGPLAGTRQRHLEAMGQVSGESQSFSKEESLPTSTEAATSEGLEPWNRKILLSFDAGGSRSISSILILKALMAEIAVQEQSVWPQAHSSASPLTLGPQTAGKLKNWTPQPATDIVGIEDAPQKLPCYLPCHYFDYIAGSGLGGLIAIMLSRLRMFAEECLEELELLLDRVLSEPRLLRARASRIMLDRILSESRHISARASRIMPRDKFSHKILERELRDMVKRKDPNGNDDTIFIQQNKDTCQCIVASAQKNDKTWTTRLILFRSYDQTVNFANEPGQRVLQRDPDPTKNFKIWEVARATTAAPMYFAPMRRGEGTEVEAYIENEFSNPTEEAIRAVRTESARNTIISIGSGSSPHVSTKLNIGGRLAGVEVPVQTRRPNTYMYQHEGLMVERPTSHVVDHYTRLNVQEGLHEMKRDRWKGKKGKDTRKLIREKTEAYLRSDSVRKELVDTAKILVETRRKRAFGPDKDHWERFCHGVEYVCTFTDCSRPHTFMERQDLRDHLEHVHRVDWKRLESLLDQGKRFPLYAAKREDVAGN